ncbi:hypothetical protein Y032_0005g2576 [Ancylostoma ceylanicum]|uniref:Uncharacterized protein n=1 Tax=Ancylostoma ceylanicum TaxID=53326 RepID=A0A016VSL7_9BILA|nr:hypothetical protein Y032_0005g2576 [Ancylostoma ceylanicum]
MCVGCFCCSHSSPRCRSFYSINVLDLKWLVSTSLLACCFLLQYILPCQISFREMLSILLSNLQHILGNSVLVE